MFEKLLVCLDGSASAEKIIPLACGISQATKGKLVFLRVVQDPAESWTEEESPERLRTPVRRAASNRSISRSAERDPRRACERAARHCGADDTRANCMDRSDHGQRRLRGSPRSDETGTPI